MERAKEVLAMEVSHVHGYQTGQKKSDMLSKIRIIERVNFLRVIVLVVILFMGGILALAVYYTSQFDPIDACSGKEDPVAHDSCYLQVALSRYNESLCHGIFDEKIKWNCVGQLGVFLNDTKICGTIPYNDPLMIEYQDRCFSCIAFKLSSFGTCREIKNYVRQSECESQIERGRSLIC